MMHDLADGGWVAEYRKALENVLLPWVSDQRSTPVRRYVRKDGLGREWAEVVVGTEHHWARDPLVIAWKAGPVDGGLQGQGRSKVETCLVSDFSSLEDAVTVCQGRADKALCEVGLVSHYVVMAAPVSAPEEHCPDCDEFHAADHQHLNCSALDACAAAHRKVEEVLGLLEKLALRPVAEVPVRLARARTDLREVRRLLDQ